MADQKITELLENTTPVSGDLLPIVDDPAGTPATQKISITNLSVVDGWMPASETWTYASATTFTVSGNVTAKYPVGTKIKLTQTTVKYFYVTAASYSAPNTTVTVTGGTDYTLADAAITANFYSYAEIPQAFPQWFNYTPTLGAISPMTFTGTTVSLAKFKMVGKTCFVSINCNGTTGGTASPSITMTLPISAFTASGDYVTHGCVVYDGAYLGGFAYNTSATAVNVRKHDSSNWGLGASRYIFVYMFYETA